MPKLNELQKDGEVLVGQEEIDVLCNYVQKTTGNIAEVGMYQGGSAQAMCEVKGDRNFYGFDTFEGIPPVLHNWRLGMFKADIEQVKKRLSKYPNVFIHKGIFPENADVIKGIKFSVVHLDVDTTEGTSGSLEYFYPSMEKGGFIIIHDYPNITGVESAVNEFASKYNLKVFPTGSSQCLIEINEMTKLDEPQKDEGKLKDLRTIKKVFDKLNLPLFLCYGTALGAYRDGDFLPDDGDIDLGTFGAENKDKIWQELKKEGFVPRGDEPFEKYKCVPVNRNTLIDLFLFADNGNGWYECHATRKTVNAKIQKKYVEKFEKVKFFGDEYLVPSPIENYLKDCYDDWQDKNNKKHTNV